MAGLGHPESDTSAYRADIDGLRAFAVVSIIAYHLHAMPLRGAFVTLDVFFVISGYLIGSHILRDVERGRFSIGGFYLRRVRRILPALLVMLGVTAAACTVLLYPDELARFGASLAAASVAGANIFFWNDTDYFAPAAQGAPLLHMWSLGVEEQFYLLFPAAILLLYRWLGPRGVAACVGLVLLASLAVASTTAFRDPSFAFYMPHTRMWEFLAGTAILYLPRRFLARRWPREAAAFVGMALIGLSMLLLRSTTPFPGLAAVPAVLGTSMVIAAGARGESIVGRMLSIAPARWIGLISYSLYLWHWPLILVYKAARPVQDLGGGEKSALFAATFMVGIVSWRLIEVPFRRAKRRPAFIVGAAAAVTAMLMIYGLLLWRSGGLPARVDPVELRLLRYERSRVHPRAPGCHLTLPGDVWTAAPCLASAGARSTILLLGDSHANHLWQALQAHSGSDVLQATAAGCRPVIDNLDSRTPNCRAVARAAFGLLTQAHPDLVLLSGRWNEDDIEPLTRTLSWLKARGQRVAISGPAAEYDASLPVLLALARHRGDPGLPMRHLVAERAKMDARLSVLAQENGVRYLSPYRAICSAPRLCRAVTPAGVPIQHDYGHLTVEGADFVVAEMLRREPLVSGSR